jgi:small GTP-binding protein
MARVQIFLSAVSDEFLSYRERLRHLLTRPDVEVKIQEDFIISGDETLEMLDSYIRGCDGVIHLVGNMTGAMAKPQSVMAIAAVYPDLASRLPLGAFLVSDGPSLSYTQWEAWLALWHGKRLFIATSEDAALRDEGYQRDPGQQALQKAHLSRLRSVGRYPGASFESPEQLAAEVLRSFVLNLLVQSAEITQLGYKATINYHYELKLQGQDFIYEAKVLIVGNGGAGKTSLLRRLYQPGLGLPKVEDSTKGIDILGHDFVTRDGKTFHLNVWDFGGQEIYHATHQFFFTKRSLYILVDDTRSNSISVHDEGFKYWLEVIEALSNNCPVLIFQNEKAGRSKTIDERGVKGRFPNVIDIYCGNLQKPDAAKQLSEAIRLQVQKLPHVGSAVPAQWVAIRSDLEAIKEQQPFLNQNEYWQIYSRHLQFDHVKALQLSQYFHDLGVFLHFQDDPFLSRTVILQNEWVTEAVYKVLNDESTKQSKGYFNRSDCKRIWADSTYADMHLELLALMEKFELCYKLPDQHPETWLTPQLLSPSEPDELRNIAHPSDLVITYQYDFLPKGMISRLMVRKHHLVLKPKLCWIGGAYFERGNSHLLARILQTGQEIELRSSGSERKDLMSVIADDLDLLNASFEGLRDKVSKLVPCICSRCKQSVRPALFSEKELIQRRINQKQTIECSEYPYENVDVYELLDGIKNNAFPAWGRGQSSEVRIIRIFLASSSELRDDRDAFELYLRMLNDRFFAQGIYLQVTRWENFLDAMSETRLQDEYNEAVTNCDIFVSLFKTKTGKFTEEEFRVAHQSFIKNKKPLIYTYFKDVQVSVASLKKDIITLLSFKEKLSRLGHYPTQYTSAEDLKLQFRSQLDNLIEEGRI